jgi:hypothetical protein
MLKCRDPFEMDDLFVGIFYNAETEALTNKDEGFREFHAPLKKVYRFVSAVWKKLREKAVVFFNRVYASGYVRMQSKTVVPDRKCFELPPKGDSRQLDAASNENTAFKFLPLTEEEKKRFVESLNEEGKRILAALEGRRKSTKEKLSGRSEAQVGTPDLVGIAPDNETTPKFDKET